MPTLTNQYKSSPGLFNPKDLLIRHAIIIVLAVLFGSMGKWDEPIDVLRKNVFSTFINIALIWNGNILLIDIVDRLLTWEKNLRTKLITSGIIALCWPILVNIAFNHWIFPIIHGMPCDLEAKENTIYLIMSVVITLFINTIFISVAFFKFWKSTIKEAEELKRESITAEFATLKNQINPHFLFNSLNTLSSLIDESPNLANQFVQKLSTVYRYVLTQKDKELVTLAEELSFVQSYIYLNQIRFASNLIVHIDVPAPCLQRKVVTLSLQILIENCIKHNIISAEKPLHITIQAEPNTVTVTNSLQRKKTETNSNGIGLNNIVHRYSLIINAPVRIDETNEQFIVELPLIE